MILKNLSIAMAIALSLSVGMTGAAYAATPDEGTSVQSAQVKISGVVVDSKGQPLPGASIVEQGTTNGTMADPNGKFTLSVKKGAKIEFSSIGYLTKTETASPG